MPTIVRVHFQNRLNLADPHLWAWHPNSSVQTDLAPAGQDDFGFIFEVETVRPTFHFKFKSGPGTNGPWESDALERVFRPPQAAQDAAPAQEIWCFGDRAFVHDQRPCSPEPEDAETFLRTLNFKGPNSYIPGSGGLSGLGANVLADGRVLFGLYHPNASRVYVIGEFNDWQRPTHEHPDAAQFIELKLYRGYFGVPNIWLGITDRAAEGEEYKFAVFGGVPSDEKGRFLQYLSDPYSRQFGPDYGLNNSVIVDPTHFHWHDGGWKTPDPADLIIYELSVYGFTEGDLGIDPAHRGKFKGVTERIRQGYFARLGVTALSLMPLSESPSPQGPNSVGYDPMLFGVVERDFGTPDDLRELVDAAHQHGLAVVLDMVFNHTSSSTNPLWQAILEHPREQGSSDGGLYFAGSTPWGNRIASEKADVQNLLIDACKQAVVEYHVDGFRFDATHTDYMDHGCVLRIAQELKGFKPDVLLIAENLPNQADLNRSGFDGFAQWCDSFHDKIKAMLREGVFENNHQYSTDRLADIFYFSRSFYAAHTNNVVNYCESHDEQSVSREVSSNPFLNTPAAKDRKARLGLFATAVALGQPMIYMGAEFNTDRERNLVTVHWPDRLDQHGFFQWASRLLRLRQRYPGLKIAGYDPESEGRFAWVLGPWMAPERGGGRRLLGWRLQPNSNAWDRMLVMVNFENHDVAVNVDFGAPGVWVKLADIDRANDLAPQGSNSASDATALRTNDGNFSGFVLPSSSGFIYKWESA